MEDWKLLHVFSYYHEALLFIAKLEAYEIPHVVQDYNTITIQPFYSQAIGGIKVWVKNQDLEVAQQLLQEYLDPNKSVNSSLDDL
ncbi:MAG: DUF2007 domain-containing protein [Bacteroidales bacterium]|nr:DUF2007 domain-containing protein [Bacteroidales bacterium]